MHATQFSPVLVGQMILARAGLGLDPNPGNRPKTGCSTGARSCVNRGRLASRASMYLKSGSQALLDRALGATL